MARIGTNAEVEGQARARQGAGGRGGGGVWEGRARLLGLAREGCWLGLRPMAPLSTWAEQGGGWRAGWAGCGRQAAQGCWAEGALGWEKGAGAIGPNGSRDGFPHF